MRLYDLNHLALPRLVLFGALFLIGPNKNIFANEIQLCSSENLKSELKTLIAKSSSSLDISGKYLTQLGLMGDVQDALESRKQVRVVQTFDEPFFTSPSAGFPANNWRWIEEKSDFIFVVIDHRLVAWASPLHDEWVLAVSTFPSNIASFEKQFNPLYERAKSAQVVRERYSPVLLTVNSKNILMEGPLHLKKGKPIYLGVSLTKKKTWRGVRLKLESNPLVLWKAISNSNGGSASFQDKPLEESPPPLFGDLREGKTWLIIIKVLNPQNESYKWSYKLSSDEPSVEGEFKVSFE